VNPKTKDARGLPSSKIVPKIQEGKILDVYTLVLNIDDIK